MSFNQNIRAVYVDNNHITVELKDNTLKLYSWQKNDTLNESTARSVIQRGREFTPSASAVNSVLQKLTPEDRAVMMAALGSAN